MTLETKMERIRMATFILVPLPYLLLVVNGGAFMFSLFPLSVITLGLHMYLGTVRRKHKLRMNEWDNIKIGVAIFGTVAGLVMWALLALLINE